MVKVFKWEEDKRKRWMEWAEACILVDGGIPVFKTHYAGMPFRRGKERVVLGVCFAGKNMVESVYWKDVPDDDYNLIEAGTRDIKNLFLKHDPKKWFELEEKRKKVQPEEIKKLMEKYKEYLVMPPAEL